MGRTRSWKTRMKIRKRAQSTKERNPRAAVAYVRVSTDKQADHGHSIDEQEARIPGYVVARDMELVVPVFREEGVSAGKPLAKRPEGAKMLEMIQRGEVAHVIVPKLDRIFRSALDALATIEEWTACGVSLHILDLGGETVSTGTANGKMMFSMLAIFAEFERNMARERTKRTMDALKAQGKAYTRTPYGWDRVDDRLVPNPHEEEVLRKMREWYDAGDSMREIAQALNAQGVPSKEGGRWHQSTVFRYLHRETA